MAASKGMLEEGDNERMANSNAASTTVSKYFSDMVNSRDLQEVIETQNAMLDKFEKTNETLSRVNELSEMKFSVLNADFRKHINMLLDMKRSLDSVFKRIRILKQTVKARYPEAYEACEVVYIPPDDEEEPTTQDSSSGLELSDPATRDDQDQL